jgi:hypothetical protein
LLLLAAAAAAAAVVHLALGFGPEKQMEQRVSAGHQ